MAFTSPASASVGLSKRFIWFGDDSVLGITVVSCPLGDVKHLQVERPATCEVINSLANSQDDPSESFPSVYRRDRSLSIKALPL